MGDKIPSPSRIVMYHHPVDHVDYPAMITEVTGGPLPDVELVEGSGEWVSAGMMPYHCYLTIFRPRAIDWKRAYEGPDDGQWSWPKRDGGTVELPAWASADEMQSLTDRIEAIENLIKDMVEPELKKGEMTP